VGRFRFLKVGSDIHGIQMHYHFIFSEFCLLARMPWAYSQGDTKRPLVTPLLATPGTLIAVPIGFA